MKNYKKQTRNILRWERRQMVASMVYGGGAVILGIIIGVVLVKYV